MFAVGIVKLFFWPCASLVFMLSGLCVHALCKSHANSCISCNNDACMAPMLPPVSKLPTFDGG